MSRTTRTDPQSPAQSPEVHDADSHDLIRVQGAVTLERGGRTVKERRSFNITGGRCPRCEGMGSVTDFDLAALYDGCKSLSEGALTIPGYSIDGWFGRIFSGCGFFDPDKPIRKFTKRELNDLLYKEPTKIKVDNINLTYEGLIPKIQKSMLSQDREAPTYGHVVRWRITAHQDDPPPRFVAHGRTYVFDEPTVGLHPHDIARMNDLLLRLRDKGNTVLVVEHKPEVIYTDLAMMAGVATICEVCEGKRFQISVLNYHLGGRDIGEARNPASTSRPTAAPEPN